MDTSPTYRCALVSPEKGQCTRRLYHPEPDHLYAPEMPWTETVDELERLQAAAAKDAHENA